MKGNKLYVGNLNYQTTEESLKTAFSEYGEVLSVRIIQGRGFGFVEMANSDQAEKAMEGMNGKEVDGRTLRVDEARPPRPKNSFSSRRRF